MSTATVFDSDTSEVQPVPGAAGADVSGASDWASKLTFRTHACLAAIFAIAVASICVWCPPGHPLNLVVAAVAGLVFFLSVVVQVPMAGGSLATGQPAFVALLFALPLNFVPLAMGVLVLTGSVIRHRKLATRRLAAWANNGWWSLVPTLILASAASGPASWHRWPLYVLAFAAQFACDVATSALWTPYPKEMFWRARFVDLVAATGIDALLTPIGLSAAVAASVAPGATISILVGVFGMMVLLARERSRRLEDQELSLRDPLTGLANRALFEELAKAAVHRCARTELSAGLLLLDLNDFKPINDQHGHLCGDHVLCGFANRICAHVRTADTLARLGGDEFVLLVAEPTTMEALEVVAANLRQALSEPLDVPELGRLTISASIGAALLDGNMRPEDALRAADHAMYAEKRSRPRNGQSRR